MAKRHGKHAVLKLGTLAAPAVLVDISSVLNQADLNRTKDTAEDTAFGQANKSYLPGMLDFQLPLGGFYDTVIDAQLSDLIENDTPVNFEYYPGGNASGETKYSGSVYVTAAPITAGVAAAVGGGATLMPAGDIARAVVP